MHHSNTPGRLDAINQAITVLSNDGPSGAALANLCRAALKEDAGNSNCRGVLLDAMQEMRLAIRTLKNELDGIDSVGIYK